MKTFRIYPNWMENGKLSWSIDSGDHRDQLIVDSFELRGCDATGGVDPRWTKEEAREEDAPKCWFEVGPADLYLSCTDGERRAVLTLGKTGPVVHGPGIGHLIGGAPPSMDAFLDYLNSLPADEKERVCRDFNGDWSVPVRKE